MRPLLPPALVLILGLAQTASGAPLYVGPQEFDTSDHALMVELVQRCAALLEESAARERPPAEGAAEDPTGDTASPPDPGAGTSAARTVLVIDVDTLVSGDGATPPAGEGVGISASGEDSDSQPRPDLSRVSLLHCQEAGVAF